METGYSLNEPDGAYQPSLLEKLMSLLANWQLAELKLKQLKANGQKGKIALKDQNKRIEAAMRQIVDYNQNYHSPSLFILSPWIKSSLSPS